MPSGPPQSDDDERQAELFDTQPPPWELVAENETEAAAVVFSENPFGPFHYKIPAELLGVVRPGMRLRVPLGKGNRAVVGWCVAVETTNVPPRSLKDILEPCDEEPLCDDKLIKLVLWMSHYYQAPAGQVFDALIPAGVRAGAGTRQQIFLTPSARALDDAQVDPLPAKQRSALRHLIAAARPLTAAQLASLAECTEAPIRQLRKKGFLAAQARRVLTATGPLHSVRDRSAVEIPELTAPQAAALASITAAIDSNAQRTLVLHGVTGSGKTEVYIQAIEAVVRQGKQAIVLVPEISLTPQTRHRFQDRFDDVAVLHSQMSGVERHFHWQRIRSGQVQVVVGARSAVFAPLPNLGLIVLDEEHDASFKQDSVPRYHARRVAFVRSQIENIPLVLGSATPSLETWYATETGHAELIQLNQRIAGRPMPHVQLVDLRTPGERVGGGAISRPLHNAVRETLAEQGQVILLLNRRGFATTIQCPSCGHVVACPECDMPLTHHRDGGKAVCHYCDYQIPTPPWCPVCKFDGIRYSGLGTQRLEVEVKARFPDAKIARMDSDTMRRPGSHERVLGQFRSGELQILLGTQMIAKGLDFPNVLLVGVINADSALHFPDFRAAERTFQLVTQVAGRTGRGNRGGRVIVQTFTPEHPAIQAASQHDYHRFAETEMLQRRKYAYPPLGSVARIIIRGPLEETTEAFADTIVERLELSRDKLKSEVRILGPAPPPIAKLRGKYRFHILLQAADATSLGETIRRAVDNLKPAGKEDIQFVIDIDPLDML
nr:primosomal protein N' [Roseimaritima sediminicola]